MTLAGLGIQAVEYATVIGDVENIVLDRYATERTVHRLAKIDFSVAVFIDRAVMPDCSRVGIRPGEVTFVGLDGLQPLGRDRLIGVRRVECELRAHVPAFGWIDAPQVSDAFSMFRIFT